MVNLRGNGQVRRSEKAEGKFWSGQNQQIGTKYIQENSLLKQS